MNRKRKIGVLSGGWSQERSVSLKSGEAVVRALDENKYEIRSYDPKTDLALMLKEREEIDLVFNLLHGKYGEDGRVQGLLEIFHMPFVGSGVLASAMAMNKRISKEMYRSAGLRVAKDRVLTRGKGFSVSEILETLGRPVVIKPVSEGSSIGISISEEEMDIKKAIERAFEFDGEVLVEAYVAGRELTCAVLGRSRLEPLPVVEIVPKKGHRFFDFEAKYTAGETTEICPAKISQNIRDEVFDLAERAHRALGCRDWSRTDMIHCDGTLYLLETNTIPGMTETSLVPLAAQGRGWGLTELLDRMISTCIEEPDF